MSVAALFPSFELYLVSLRFISQAVSAQKNNKPLTSPSLTGIAMYMTSAAVPCAGKRGEFQKTIAKLIGRN